MFYTFSDVLRWSDGFGGTCGSDGLGGSDGFGGTCGSDGLGGSGGSSWAGESGG